MDKKIYYHALIFLSFCVSIFTVINLSPISYAQACTTCGNGFYACGSGCCHGGGCPSSVCGSCPTGWVPSQNDPGSSICYGSDGSPVGYCNAQCQGCPGSGQGNCGQSCQRGCSNGTQGAWCGISGNGFNQYWCTQCSSPPPPPPPTATVAGKVWSDDNSNGTIQNSENWGVPSIAACVTAINGHLSTIMSYTAAVTWACSGNLPQWFVSGLGVGSNFSRTLLPPKNYFCSQATWSGTVCTNSSCSTTRNYSGSGCAASLTSLTSNPNSLLYKIKYNAPPTGSITYPVPAASHVMADGTIVLNRTIAQAFSGIVNSPDNDISAISLEYRPYDSVSKLDINPGTVFGSLNGSGSTLSKSSTITIPRGYYSYYVRGTENVGNYCVGRFGLDPTTQNRCDVDTNPATTDRIAIYGDTPPVCSTTYGSYSWPTTPAIANTPMLFSSNAPDVDGSAVKYNWSATCGRYPNLRMVRIAATTQPIPARPRLTLLITKSDGSRVSYGPINTNNSGAAFNYDVAVNVDGATMIEVAFDNAATGSGKANSVRVNSISLFENPTGPALTTISPASSTVFYDPANTATGVLGVTYDYYDGVNAAGVPATPTNTGNMAANGLLRFPSVWVTPSSLGASCTVGLTPRANNPLYYDGNSCSVTYTGTVRSVSGTLYDMSGVSGGSCTSSSTITGSSANVQLYNNALSVGAPAATISGTFSVTPLYSSDVFNSLCINGVLGDGSKAYSYSCYNSPQLTCTPSSGNCLATCTPTNALATGDITLNLGFNAATNDKWFTVLDGDFYSSNVSAFVTTTPADNFTSNLINTETTSSIGGYGFAGGTIDTQTPTSKVSEKGGSATKLNSVNSYNFEDKWLNSYSFVAPSNTETAVPSGNTFEDGKIYKFTNAQISSVLSDGSYSITGGVGSNPKVAFIYVEDPSTININSSFTSSSADEMLVLITQAPVDISETIKVPSLTGYTVTSNSQIDLVVLSKNDITFKSKYNASSSTYDNPIVANGAFLSKTLVDLNRNLGGANNALYPSIDIRYIPALLYRIMQLETTANATLNFTGISKFDLQWNYGN